MTSRNDEYQAKCLELEELLRRHFSRKDFTQRKLRFHLQEESSTKAQLNERIDVLQDELRRERQLNRELQATQVENERLFRDALQERDVQISKLRKQLCDQLRRADSVESDFLEKLRAVQSREVAVAKQKSEAEQLKDMLEASLVAARRQADADTKESTRARQLAEQYLQQAKSTADEVAAWKEKAEASLYEADAVLQCVQAEAKARLMVGQSELAERTAWCLTFVTDIVGLVRVSAAQLSQQEASVASAANLLSIKEREVNARVRREHDRLCDEFERLQKERSEFRLERGSAPPAGREARLFAEADGHLSSTPEHGLLA